MPFRRFLPRKARRDPVGHALWRGCSAGSRSPASVARLPPSSQRIRPRPVLCGAAFACVRLRSAVGAQAGTDPVTDLLCADIDLFTVRGLSAPRTSAGDEAHLLANSGHEIGRRGQGSDLPSAVGRGKSPQRGTGPSPGRKQRLWKAVLKVSVVESIHIDGEWRPATAGGTREILDPADATTLAVVAEGGTAGHRRGRRRRPPRLRRRRVAPHARRRTRRAAAAGRGPAPAGPRGDRAHRVPRHRQDPGRGPRRRRRRHQRLPLLRRPRHERVRRPGRRRGRPRCAQRRRARARGRLRHDHALELPAPPGQLEGRPGAGGRQHLRPQAQRDHPDVHGPPGRSCSSRPGCRPAWPTSSPAPATPWAPGSPSTPTSTWSPSPAGSPAARRSPRPPRPPSRRSRSSSAARTPTSCSPTPAPPKRASTPPSTRR